MSESNSPAPAAREPDPDPEIEALLHFTPVHRRTKRHDGWPAEVQRRFIAFLARLGHYEHAAFAVNRSGSGAWKVRKAGDGAEFSAAWDGAMALYQSRNPKKLKPVPGTGERASRGRRRGSSRAREEERPPRSPEEAEQATALIFDVLMDKYRVKMGEERRARLEGEIGHADFCVRQLTYLEVLLDLAGRGHEVADLLRTFRDLTPDRMEVVAAAATPVSLYLDGVRRAVWRDRGEPERPPLGELGHIQGGIATGPRHWHHAPKDGPYDQWLTRQKEASGLAAQAQAAWEEKAKAEAEAWRKREEGEGGA